MNPQKQCLPSAVILIAQGGTMKKKTISEPDQNRNSEMGNPTSDKAFKDTRTLKRHQGIPNAGGGRTGKTKIDNGQSNEN